MFELFLSLHNTNPNRLIFLTITPGKYIHRTPINTNPLSPPQLIPINPTINPR